MKLVLDLKDGFKQVYVIRDALEPRRIRDAIAEDFEVGINI